MQCLAQTRKWKAIHSNNSFTEALSTSWFLCFAEAVQQHSLLEEHFLDSSPSIDTSFMVFLSELKIVGTASGLSLSF